MPDLPTRVLGRTGLHVTTLGFGALELRGMVAGVGRPLLPGQPERILNAVLDAGINYIDVAVDYGEAEAHMGRWISRRRREARSRCRHKLHWCCGGLWRGRRPHRPVYLQPPSGVLPCFQVRVPA